MEKIKILHYIPNFKYGGIETNIISLLNNLDDGIIFDFLIENDDIPTNFKELVKSKNGKIFKVSNFRKHPFLHVKQINKIMVKEKYNIVEAHSFSTRPLLLKIAKKNNVEQRILHIHSINRNNNYYKLIKKINERIAIKNANYYIACSNEAGKAYLNKEKFFILPNGINVEKFKYSEIDRKEYRKKLNIENKKVYGHVGRLTYLKNHEYLINVFKSIILKEPNSVLLLVGTGEEKKNILKNIKDIKEKIIILENRDDINKILSAMDVFIFPSITEGFGIALLEAQVNGLPCYISKTLLEDVIISDNVRKIDINDAPQKVAEEILKSNLKRKMVEKDKIYKYSEENTSKAYFNYILTITKI